MPQTLFQSRTRLLLALLLAGLALLFAVEAKRAWYAPHDPATSQLSAAKAWPAESPSRASLGESIDHSLLARLILLLASAAFGLSASSHPWLERAKEAPAFFAASGLSFALFFRPPPAR